jgi:beta-alanine degradation protein BauB
VRFENDRVRVLEYRDRPGGKQHHDPAFLLFALSPFKRTITLPNGKVLTREFKAGDMLQSDAQTHVGENVGDTPTMST